MSEKNKISAEEYLKKKGIAYKVVSSGEQALLEECPFCHRKRKFYISLGKDGLPFDCKVCGERGNLITLQRFLGDKPSNLGKPKPITEEEQKPQINPKLVDKYYKNLVPKIKNYLKKNWGLNDNIIAKHKLGWDKAKKEILIPITNDDLRYVFFIRHILDSKKTIYQKGGYNELFGWDRVSDGNRPLVIAEGIKDRLCLEAQGIPSISSTGGASYFPDKAIGYLKQIKELYIVYDRDSAGVKGAEALARKLPRAKIVKLPFPLIPDGVSSEKKKNLNKDVTDYFLGGKKKKDFLALLKKAKPLIQKQGSEPAAFSEKKFVQVCLSQLKDEFLEKKEGSSHYQTLKVLSGFIGESGKCFPKEETIAKELPVRREAVSARIQRLEESVLNGLKVLEVERRRSKSGKILKNHYKFFPMLPRPNMVNEEEVKKLLNKAKKTKNNTMLGQPYSNINNNNTGKGKNLLEELKSGWQKNKSYLGLPTGFNDLDTTIGGLRKGQVMIIGGWSGQGKTTFGLNIAYNVAKENKRVSYITLQTSKEELEKRLLCKKANIDIFSLEGGKSLSQKQKSEIEFFYKEINSLPLDLMKKDLSIGNLNDLRQLNSSLLIIDYVQNIGPLSGGIYKRISKIMVDLEKIALDLNIPVIVFSQLKDIRTGSGVVTPKTRLPHKSDLEGGQPLHQHAQVVLLLYATDRDKALDKLRVIIAKNNDGKEGKEIIVNYRRKYFDIYS